ncbi:GIY-YIG nuclease family protein [Shewanella sp. WXL01]|uniref:GIY-YIG nuclease family protein n=1 Tax=Shewanella maritima TaxID=2520507 RepID=A0A411PHR9_9GAMM|nr:MULTISPECIES: GIY-YIG nuclease family protein [Shewanella]NKF52512.1 GIY-YIG nuclease family protein [Shewanella sp. WXL01]QBF82922.1 GIY-YIG nuclease family protein [Shewanella maritima]
MPQNSLQESAQSAWFVYIIECAKGTLYTGITTDVARRFDEHQHGIKGAKYLKGKGPLRLVYQEAQQNRSLATKRELEIKKMTRSKKLALITSKKSGG